MSAAASEVIRKTALYALHLQNKAKMVPFCGWSMPIQYSTGIVTEHKHTRSAIGIFDVSHMGQLTFHGKGAADFIEWLTPVDLQTAAPGTTKLSVLLNEKCGIIDDIMVTKDSTEDFYMVVNAGRYTVDIPHIRAALDTWHAKNPTANIKIQYHNESTSLLALQGPKASALFGSQLPDVAKMSFMTSRVDQSIFGASNVRITRCGYTGEDGYEIAVTNDRVEELLNSLLQTHPEDCKLIGLGARDSLRMEAGLCLYGHELNEDITPREAGLMWTISKRRKEAGGFIGSECLKTLLTQPLLKKRVGVAASTSGPPAREGTSVCINDTRVGAVTSGCPSPTLGVNIAQVYIDAAHSATGCEVQFDIRGKKYDAKVVPLPFVKANYYR